MDVLRFMNETGTSLLDTAARYNIPAPSTISQWKRVLEERGIDALQPMKKGRPSMKKEDKQLVPEGSKEALQAEVKRLRMENAFLKKVECLSSKQGKITKQDKAQVIFELSLNIPLLHCCNSLRSHAARIIKSQANEIKTKRHEPGKIPNSRLNGCLIT
jgi:transposase-like protein